MHVTLAAFDQIEQAFLPPYNRRGKKDDVLHWKKWRLNMDRKRMSGELPNDSMI